MTKQRIMYVCSECADGCPEACGHYDRNELRVMPDGMWLCESCFDNNDDNEFLSWGHLLAPEEHGPIPTSAQCSPEALALADRIDATKRSWLPIAGHVVNVTLSLDDADRISKALRSTHPEGDRASPPIPPDTEEELLGSIKLLMDQAESLRETLASVMRQAEYDLKTAHAEICKLSGLDTDKHTWPTWTPQANSLRWFVTLREKFGIDGPSQHPSTMLRSPSSDQGDVA